MIKVGEKLPEATFMVMTAEGPSPMTTRDIFGGKKVVLFAVPGAFTPTCHATHLPDFVNNAQAIEAKGVDTIACVSVNDVHVMNAWGKAGSPDGEVLMLADGSGEFAKGVGLDVDLTAVGMGLRSQRYSMIVDDGTVLALNVESKPGQAVDSGAANILAQL